MLAKDDHDEMDLKDKKLSWTWNATGKLNFFFLGHKICTGSLLTILLFIHAYHDLVFLVNHTRWNPLLTPRTYLYQSFPY